MSERVFHYGDDFLSVSVVMSLLDGTTKGVLSDETRLRIAESASHVQEIVANKKPVYGINTGFGPLCDTRISDSETTQLQHNLLQSHAVGVGDPIDRNLSKLMLITKVHALAKGFSGIRMQTLERIIWHIENDLIPIVPEKGSVGASGDLAPLAHLFLPLIGLGEVYCSGRRMSAGEMMQHKRIETLELGAKEGLALINGTQFIVAHAIKCVHLWKNILDSADVIGALSLEALMGSASPFDERLHNIRAFKGAQYVAKRLRLLLNNSEILGSHADCDRIQDPYSLRCIPQVHGASRNAWLHLKELTEIEMNSVTDNPVILGSGETISGGNFHGQLLALPLDYAAFASAEIGNMSDRRSYMMLEGRYGLPKLLIKNAGVNSGFMVPQYTSAALVTENKTLCYPASADSVPTSLGQEDHVSMGSISGRKTIQILNNLTYILAIELLYASQALEFRRPLRTSKMLEKVYELVREKVDFAENDRVFATDIEVLRDLILNNEINSLLGEFDSSSAEYAQFTV